MPSKHAHELINLLPGLAYRCLNDEVWTMLEVSPGIEMLTGYPASDFINNNVRNYSSLIHPDDQQMVWEDVQTGLDKEGAFDLEYRIIHADGKVRHVWEHGSSISHPDGTAELVGFICDRTSKARHQYRIRRAQQAVVDLSCSRHLSQGNIQAFAKELCLTATQVLHVERASVWLLDNYHKELQLLCLYETHGERYSHDAVLLADDYPRYFDALKTGRAINASFAEEDERTAEFSENYLLATGVKSMLDACIRLSGEIIGVVCCEKVDSYQRWAIEDISFAGELADQVSHAIANQRHHEDATKIQQIETSSRTKSRLLSTISHEIRTPMNGVLGMVELLKQTPLNDLQQQHLQVIHDSGELLMTIINDVLDYAKADEGKLTLRESSTNIEQAFNNTIALLSNLIPDGVKLINERLPGLPDHLLLDAHRLRQVTLNLLGNAIKFTRQGYITFRYGPLDQHRWQIEISDTGPGISQERLPQLFTPFEQLHDDDLLSPQRGTGLGLTICQQIIDSMGGDIRVDSTVGQGTTFTVTLPLRMTIKPQEKESSATKQYPNMKVLIAEDNSVNRVVIKGLLKTHGINPTLCEDGLQALEIIKQSQGDFDLILMDGQMPKLNGFEAARHIRQLPDLKQQPIIAALTAHALEEFRLQANEAGMNHYLTKPVQKKEIAELLAQTAAQQSLQ